MGKKAKKARQMKQARQDTQSMDQVIGRLIVAIKGVSAELSLKADELVAGPRKLVLILAALDEVLMKSNELLALKQIIESIVMQPQRVRDKDTSVLSAPSPDHESTGVSEQLDE